jgi:perosamine synthetase
VIPVFEPEISEEEIEAVVAALRRGEISGSFGTAIDGFEQAFARYCGVRHGIAVTSGTTALHLAVAAAELEPGGEILMSASTNIATALAAFHNGFVPVPVDSEAVTWNMDLSLLDSLVTSQTRAVIPVHLFGHPVDMDALMTWASDRGLVVIEDCAESHGAKCRGRMTGSFGHMACFSFYANKIITTGEGGMVITDDDAMAERLRLLRNLAFTEPRFRHEAAGFNFRMTGYQAAMGSAQLNKIEEVIANKRRVAETYNACLADIEWLRLPVERDWAFNVYWMYGVVVENGGPVSRDELAAHLREEGIDSRTFFCPMNQQPFLKNQPGYRPVECRVADRLWADGMYLPSSPALDSSTIERIAAVMRSVQP